MSIQISGIKKVLMIVAICLTNFIIMTDYVLLSITNNLYTDPRLTEAGVNFILSGPALFLVAASLIVPFILRKVEKKTMIIIATSLFCITTIFGCAIVSVPYMIACRVIGGFCVGTIQVCGVALIADIWIDENKRASFMGIYNATMAGIGAIMGFVSGFLALKSWENAYNIYWFGIVVLLMAIFFIPKLRENAQNNAEAAAADTATAAPAAKRGFGSRFWCMIVAFFLFQLAYGIVFTYFISVFVAEQALGDTALSGTLASLGTVGSMCFCLAFGFNYSKMHSMTSVPFYIGQVVCIIVMVLFPNPVIAMIACTLCGGCYGSVFSYLYAEGTVIVPVERIDMAIGIITAVQGIGMFLSTYVETFLMGIMGGTATATFIPLALVVAVGLVIEFISIRAYTAKGKAVADAA